MSRIVETDRDGHDLQERIFPYSHRCAGLPALRVEYAQAEPFPNIVLDQFLQPWAAEGALAEFPSIDSPDWIQYKHVNENKLGKGDRSSFGPTLGAVIDELNSWRFLRFLSDLTGIESLLADPSLQGGGLHLSARGGFLTVHADFTVHPYHRTWRRRINLLVYLNKQWEDSYGGHLELWDRQMQRCARRIAPHFNRAVIFNTEPDSFHGHPDPMTCPPGVTRKSLALYYYTEEPRPSLARSTEYRARPGEGMRSLWIYLDKMMLRLYTHLKWRFGFSDRFASRVLRILSRLNLK